MTRVEKIRKTIENVSLSEDQLREILNSRGEDAPLIFGDIAPGERKDILQWSYYFYRDTKNILTRRIEVVDTIKNLFGVVKRGIVSVGKKIESGAKKVAKVSGGFFVIASKIATIAFLIYDGFGFNTNIILKKITSGINIAKETIIDIGNSIKNDFVDKVFDSVPLMIELLKRFVTFFTDGTFVRILRSIIVDGGSFALDVLWVGMETLEKMVPSWKSLVENTKGFFKTVFGAELKISVPRRTFTKESLFDKKDVWTDDGSTLMRRATSIENIIERLKKEAEENDNSSTIARLKEMEFFKLYNDNVLMADSLDYDTIPEDVLNALKGVFEDLCLELGDSMSPHFKLNMTRRLRSHEEQTTKEENLELKTPATEKSMVDLINFGNDVLYDNFIVNFYDSARLYQDNFINRFINPFWNPIKQAWINHKSKNVTYDPSFPNVFEDVTGSNERVKNRAKIVNRVQVSDNIDEKPRYFHEKMSDYFNSKEITRHGYTRKEERLYETSSGGVSSLDILQKGINLRDYIPANNGDINIIRKDEYLKEKIKHLNEKLKRYFSKVEQFKTPIIVQEQIALIEEISNDIQNIPTLNVDMRQPLSSLS